MSWARIWHRRLKRTRLFKTNMGGVFCCPCRPQYININEELPCRSIFAKKYIIVKTTKSYSGYNFNFEAVVKTCRGCGFMSDKPQCVLCKYNARIWARTGLCPYCNHKHSAVCSARVIVERDDVIISTTPCECAYALVEVR